MGRSEFWNDRDGTAKGSLGHRFHKCPTENRPFKTSHLDQRYARKSLFFSSSVMGVFYQDHRKYRATARLAEPTNGFLMRNVRISKSATYKINTPSSSIPYFHLLPILFQDSDPFIHSRSPRRGRSRLDRRRGFRVFGMCSHVSRGDSLLVR